MIPSKSDQMRNVNTVRWESRNITTQPGKADDRKSEVIEFVVNAGMNIIANFFYIYEGHLESNEYSSI